MSRIAQSSRSIQYRQRRSGGRFQLNLVALMDVFTILVFFFLAHSSDYTSVADDDPVSLPESLANQKPRDTPVITITPRHILLQGEPVADAVASLDAAGQEIGSLRTALLKQRSSQAAQPGGTAQPDQTSRPNRQMGAEPQGNRPKAVASATEITIMGDRSIPFRLLKKVMLTCTLAGYDQISLSVLQRSTQPRAP